MVYNKDSYIITKVINGYVVQQIGNEENFRIATTLDSALAQIRKPMESLEKLGTVSSLREVPEYDTSA